MKSYFVEMFNTILWIFNYKIFKIKSLKYTYLQTINKQVHLYLLV
jgi:hypothetical protein